MVMSVFEDDLLWVNKQSKIFWGLNRNLQFRLVKNVSFTFLEQERNENVILQVSNIRITIVIICYLSHYNSLIYSKEMPKKLNFLVYFIPHSFGPKSVVSCRALLSGFRKVEFYLHPWTLPYHILVDQIINDRRENWQDEASSCYQPSIYIYTTTSHKGKICQLL